MQENIFPDRLCHAIQQNKNRNPEEIPLGAKADGDAGRNNAQTVKKHGIEHTGRWAHQRRLNALNHLPVYGTLFLMFLFHRVCKAGDEGERYRMGIKEILMSCVCFLFCFFIVPINGLNRRLHRSSKSVCFHFGHIE